VHDRFEPLAVDGVRYTGDRLSAVFGIVIIIIVVFIVTVTVSPLFLRRTVHFASTSLQDIRLPSLLFPFVPDTPHKPAAHGWGGSEA
jgi:hypothetical protein